MCLRKTKVGILWLDRVQRYLTPQMQSILSMHQNEGYTTGKQPRKLRPAFLLVCSLRWSVWLLQRTEIDCLSVPLYPLTRLVVGESGWWCYVPFGIPGLIWTKLNGWQIAKMMKTCVIPAKHLIMCSYSSACSLARTKDRKWMFPCLNVFLLTDGGLKCEMLAFPCILNIFQWTILKGKYIPAAPHYSPCAWDSFGAHL